MPGQNSFTKASTCPTASNAAARFPWDEYRMTHVALRLPLLAELLKKNEKLTRPKSQNIFHTGQSPWDMPLGAGLASSLGRSFIVSRAAGHPHLTCPEAAVTNDTVPPLPKSNGHAVRCSAHAGVWPCLPSISHRFGAHRALHRPVQRQPSPSTSRASRSGVAQVLQHAAWHKTNPQPLI